MAFLAINGVEIDVAVDSLDELKREVGSTSRAHDGTFVRERFDVKYDFRFDTPPMTQADAFAWDCFVRGMGDVFTFNTNMYSVKGRVNSYGPSSSIDTGEKKYGAAGLKILANDSHQIDNLWDTDTGLTVMLWRQATAGGGFTHYLFQRDQSGNSYYWTAGASKTAGYPNWFSSNSGSIVLQAVTEASNRWYDDVVAFPFLVPDSWVPSLYTRHAASAWYAPPSLELSGDVIWGGSSDARIVRGTSDSSKVLKAIIGGSLRTNARKLSISLRET